MPDTMVGLYTFLLTQENKCRFSLIVADDVQVISERSCGTAKSGMLSETTKFASATQSFDAKVVAWHLDGPRVLPSSSLTVLTRG